MSGDHWHLLGAGALGCRMGEALAGAGCRLTLVLRQTSGPGIARVVVERSDSRRELQLASTGPADPSPIQRLLVVTKSQDARAALAGIAHRLSPESTVLLLVNGMGAREELLADFPHLSLFSGTTTEAAYRVAPLHVRHTGSGSTRLGHPDMAIPPPWFEPWRNALPDCCWEPDIERALWQKLAINCAVNPLTALHRCRNGALAQRPELADAVDGLCTEIAAVTRAAGYSDIAHELNQSVARVIAATADNRSSMLQDALAGRPLEIDYITGYLVKTARQLGVAVPRNRALLRQLLSPTA